MYEKRIKFNHSSTRKDQEMEMNIMNTTTKLKEKLLIDESQKKSSRGVSSKIILITI